MDWITELQNYLREVNPFNKQWGHPPDPETAPILTGRLPSGYRAMPSSPNVQDLRGAPFDYKSALQNAPQMILNTYPNTQLPGGLGIHVAPKGDPMPTAGSVAMSTVPPPSGPLYQPSFSPGWRPPYTGQAPYRPSEVGPWLPSGPTGTSLDPEMPYAGAHLPISPGDPGWTPPTSTPVGSGRAVNMLVGQDPSMTFTPGMSGLLGR